MTAKNKKIYVAMSGGVDSAVSAALLKERGYDVVGVFMNVWQPDFIVCERGDDRREAMRVAAKLGIPFEVFDFEDAYKKHVVDYMITEYKEGRTPNPDVMCNKYIKFGLFFERARTEGAECIATGHYARISKENELMMGVDKNKDQTYFLWTLNQEHLAHTLFPVGELKKKEVREYAKKFELPNAERKESQGVCFIGEFDMKEFLRHYIKEEKGDLLNTAGEVIGWHNGALFYTIGERHGFTVTKKTPHDTPYYVVDKNVEKNTLTVSDKKEQLKKAQKSVVLYNVNFINGETPSPNHTYYARVRYRQPLEPCTLKEKNGYTVVFEKPQTGVASGQSLVLYDGEVCLGGGVIQ